MMQGNVICVDYTDEWLFETRHQAADGGGLHLTFCTRVLEKVKGEALQTGNGCCCEEGYEKCLVINANCVVSLFQKDGQSVFTGNIWHVFLYLLLGVCTTPSWHKYVKRVAAELPFMAVKINIHTWQRMCFKIKQEEYLSHILVTMMKKSHY